MKIHFSALLFFLLTFQFVQAQKNISRLGAWYSNNQTLAGCWHYVDNEGNEYALVGAAEGIMILDVSNPATPVFLFQLPGLPSLWHEVKVSGNYAYAVSEAQDPDTLRDGLQIINLSYLPDSAPSRFWHSDGIMTDQLRQAHSITVDDNYIYVNGHSVPNHGHGVFILDKSDPWNPVYVGAESVRYCHDSYVRGDTLWTSDIQDGLFSVYDITNRANPVLLATQQTPYSFNHNAWLSDDGNFLFTTDERVGAPIGSFDVSDLSNITLVDAHYSNNLLPSESHNVRVLNDYIINAGYGSQVTIIDATHPDNLIEVGNYQTGNWLCWDVDPYLPSGILIATDTQSDSVYLLQPTYVRACYLEGVVTDSITGMLLNDAKIDITAVGLHDSTNLSGVYKTGLADSGLYMVAYSRSGYVTKTLPVQLNNGVLTVVNVELVDSSHAGVGNLSTEPLIWIENSPASVAATIHFSESLFARTSEIAVSVTDETGKIVLEDARIQTDRIRIEKTGLAAGMYFFVVTGGGKVLERGRIVFQ